MNKEIRYDDVKQKNGQVTICLRFFAENNVDDEFNSDIYLPIYVKAVDLTDDEIDKYSGIEEICRLNATKWRVLGAPEASLKYVKKLIGKDLWCYYNGAECSWKFLDPDGDVDRKNANLYVIKNKITDKVITDFCDACVDCYEPHDDSKNNYGDESVHAVYDLKCQI